MCEAHAIRGLSRLATIGPVICAFPSFSSGHNSRSPLSKKTLSEIYRGQTCQPRVREYSALPFLFGTIGTVAIWAAKGSVLTPIESKRKYLTYR